MGVKKRCVRWPVAFLLVWGAASVAIGADPGPSALREAADAAATSRVRVGMKAEGLFLQAAPPGTDPAKAPKPLSLKVEVVLDYYDRILAVDPSGRPARSARRIVRAGTAVNGEIRPFAVAARPEAVVVVADAGPDGVVLFSPRGPLTRHELELLEEPGDPLVLGQLLPDASVKPGDRWKVGEAAARSLSGYDAIAGNRLEATLVTIDDASAKARLAGEIQGSHLGGEGTIKFEGAFTFDRKRNQINALTLRRDEKRRPGMVEEGLDIRSTLTLTREPATAPSDLTPEGLSGLTLEPDAKNLAVLFQSPDGKYALQHDRSWHVYWDSDKLSVLKRVQGGRLTAQCNLNAGPNAGKGRHQEPSQFRDDIRKSLANRFVRFLGEGEAGGDPAGGFRYKVGVQGRQDDIGVVWYYYLIAGPEGDQVLATFTLAENQVAAFSAEDENLMASFRWLPQGKAAPR